MLFSCDLIRFIKASMYSVHASDSVSIWSDWQEEAALAAPSSATPEAMLVATLYQWLRRTSLGEAVKLLVCAAA